MGTVEKQVYAVFEVALAALCCLGNALVIWAVVGWCRALRQTTFCFVVSLAVADLLVGLVAVPLAVLVDDHLETGFYSCLFIICVVLVLTQASVHSLLVIAVDRFLRVLNPLRYRGSVKPQKLCAAVLLCWLSAVLLGLMPLLGWHQDHLATGPNATIKCKFTTVMSMSYMVNFNFPTCILLPTVFMTIVYSFIFRKISRQLRKEIGRAPETTTFYRKEKRLAHSLALVLVLFAVSWFPLHVMNTLVYYGVDVPAAAIHTGVLLSHANSAVNPIVYAFKVPKIRTAFKKLLLKLMMCKKDGEPSSQSASSNSNSNLKCTPKIKPRAHPTPDPGLQ